jgi:hypothetical protein
MAASSAADIPESKSDYCPCNRCTVARKQGIQEVVRLIRELHKPVKSYKGRDHAEIVGCYECEETGSGREYWVEYPCETIKILDGIK